MTVKRVTTSGSFRMLIGSRPYCSDPAWNGHTPPTPRSTVTMGPVTMAGTVRNARVTPTLPPVGMSGSFTVADNDFTTGRAEILLGNVRLLSGVEYAIGAAATDTAHNIAAAISALGAGCGFAATHLLAVVTVVASNTMGEIEFRALHYGSHVNFTPLIPDTNMLGGGDPVIGAPLLT